MLLSHFLHELKGTAIRNKHLQKEEFYFQFIF